MKGLKGTRLKLLCAAESGCLIRFERRFEHGSVAGYVVAVGPEFFVVSYLNGDIRFDGFQAFRIQDIRHLKVPNPHTDFFELALQIRGDVRPENPPISVATLPELIQSGAESFPLVTIHCEEVDPDICYIGRVKSLNKKRVVLKAIDPHANWLRTPCGIAYLMSPRLPLVVRTKMLSGSSQVRAW